ncbi:MAG: DUF2252 family protein [Candidatus Sericytochromatia bacterium]
MNKKHLVISFIAFTLLTSCSASLENTLAQDETVISGAKNSFSRDPVAIIKKANQTYQSRYPELVKLKYDSMKESPHDFFRATTYLFYQDLAKTPFFNGEQVSVQGDLHLENIGTYKTTSGFSYDFNDFDDSVKGSFTWDLARCAVSIYLTSQQNGFSKDDSEKYVEKYLETYFDYIKALKGNSTEINNPISSKYMSDKVKKLIDNVASTSSSSFISSFSNGEKLTESSKIKKLDANTYNALISNLKTYFGKTLPNYNVKDVAFYISGKGSLGRYRYLAMLQNKSNSKDILFMDIKEAVQPNSASVIGKNTENQAQRVVNYTKMFLPKIGYFLGNLSFNNSDFFVRSLLADDKVNLEKVNKDSEIKDFIDTVAYLTAKGHSKSNKNDKILSYKDKVSDLKSFAKNYAEQVKADYVQFKQNI